MIDKEETKLLQYADDMTALLSDINSAQALFDLLEVIIIIIIIIIIIFIQGAFSH